MVIWDCRVGLQGKNRQLRLRTCYFSTIRSTVDYADKPSDICMICTYIGEILVILGRLS